jgi:hypothetical protein
MMNFIISLLEPISRLFSKYGIIKALGYILIIIFVGVIMYSGYAVITLDSRIDKGITRVLDERKDDEIATHEAGVEKRIGNMDEINRSLRECLYITDADRACVLEMHNGTNNTAGLPFIYCEMSYEQVRDGVMPVGDDYAKLNLTRYSFPYYLQSRSYYSGSIKDAMKIDNKIATKMSHDGTEYILVYELESNGKSIGYLAMTWNDETAVDLDADKIAKVTMMASSMAKLLD